MEISIIKIGNSKGFRLSKAILKKCNIKDKVEMILEKGHIILKPISNPRNGWEEAFKEMNKYLRTIVVAPITTVSKAYPTRVKVKHENKSGWVVLGQIRTIDKQRIMRVVGALSGKEIRELKSTLKETYVD